MADHSGNGKIVDLKTARKKATTAPKADRRAGANGSSDGYDRAMKAQRGQKGVPAGRGAVKWVHYVQVIVLLLLVSWLMHTCHM